MNQQAERWLQVAVARPEPRQRLICFPHAGGSASFFRDWGNHLADTEVFAVRYPGRAERIDEPSPTDLRRLAQQVAGAIAALDDRPLVLFGHSMGAVVALETARALQDNGVRPSHLIASGSRNAPLPDPEEFSDDDDDVFGQLIELGGIDPQLAGDPFFRALVLPYVRGDGRMFHAYAHRREPLLHCPVTTIVGDADVSADRRPWLEMTDGGFREQVVPGGHFYLISSPPYRLIRQSLVANGRR